MKTALIVPTLNAGTLWSEWLAALAGQTVRADMELVVDSASTDDTVELAQRVGLRVYGIARADFNHGGTRQQAVDLCEGAEVLVFLTQDAILADATALERLIACFDDPTVGAAYGRQLPHRDATAIAAHARLFNYPAESRTRSFEDRHQLGIKTAFISNSFAAYRRSALMEVGGFPTRVIFGEDTYTAARMLRAGWKVRYCAEACVRHSHNYSVMEDFRRNFDIGVFHTNELWLEQSFGRAEKEGARFVASELRYLAGRNPLLLVSAVARTAVKLIGYRLGRMERSLPLRLRRRLSMSKTWWHQREG